MSRIGTPLQAIKFSQMLNEADASIFLHEWINNDMITRWEISPTFAEFCAANPDEPERGDGRKAHYGSGRQPLDDIFDMGWGPAFCAGNVLKYMRRDKQVEDSRAKARWYYRYLRDDAGKHPSMSLRRTVQNTLKQLDKLLTANEIAWLRDGD